MHQEAPLKNYQIAKESSSKNKFIQKSIPAHSKSTVKHDLICYLTMSVIYERMGNLKMNSVSEEYVRETHANISTSSHI